MPDKEAQFEQRLSQVEGLLNQLIRSDRMTFYKHLQILDGRNIQLGQGIGTKIGIAITDKLGFYNATPIIQMSSASQAAVATTAATQTTPWGYSTQAQAEAMFNLQNELRAALVALGLIKGSS